jgi:3-methyladenine DNA glycosylase AlkD
MDIVEKLVREACATKDKFTLLQELSGTVFSQHGIAVSFDIARKLFAQPDYRPRALATYIFGHCASQQAQSLEFLRKKVSLDNDWRVQEILAQAFDNYCSVAGYEKALPTIADWLTDNNPNVRRAVTEGLRIWTGRPYFKEHPEMAIRMLSALRADASAYVRKSVGNALKDISKRHAQLVKSEIGTWDLSSAPVKETYKFASKHLSGDKSETAPKP